MDSHWWCSIRKVRSCKNMQQSFDIRRVRNDEQQVWRQRNIKHKSSEHAYLRALLVNVLGAHYTFDVSFRCLTIRICVTRVENKWAKLWRRNERAKKVYESGRRLTCNWTKNWNYSHRRMPSECALLSPSRLFDTTSLLFHKQMFH